MSDEDKPKTPRRKPFREQKPRPKEFLAPTHPTKGGRPGKLTPETQRLIISMIHAGAYSWVAAGAAGISVFTFNLWLARGHREACASEETGAELSKYALFYDAVTQARAVARLSAERRVMTANPLAWLRFGPGRERAGEEGWTNAQQLEVTGADRGPLLVQPAPLDLSKLNPQELHALESALAKCLPLRATPTGEGGKGET